MLAHMRSNLALLFAGLASYIVMGAGQSLYGPALPSFARTFSVDLAAAGLLISAHWVGCAFGVAAMFLAGHRIAPWHASILMMAGAAMVGWNAGWTMTLTGAFAFGIGYGLCTVIFNRRFLLSFGARGPAMVSFVNAIFGVGAIGAPLLFVALDSQTELTFMVVAGLSLLTLLGSAWLSPTARETGTTAAPVRINLGILLLGMAAIAAEACLIGLGPIALIALGETEVHAAELLSAFFVAFLVARLILAFFANAVPSFILLIGALVCAGLSCIVTVALNPSLGFIAIGACAGLFFPPYFVCATQLMGNNPRITPIIVAGGLVGGISAPPLMGIILGMAGEQSFFWLMAGLMLIAATLGMLFRARLHPALSPAV